MVYRMNLAILIPELGGGGAERVAKLLGDVYVARGDHVFYFVGDFGVKPVQQVAGTVVNTHLLPMESYPVMGTWMWWLLLLRHALVMRKWKKRYHIDCSVSFMEEFNYLNVLSRCGDRVIVRVCTILSARPELCSRFYLPQNLHRIYSRADAVVTMTQDGETELRERYGIPQEKIVVIPNPGNAAEALPVARTWEYGTRAIVVVGRLEPVKQQDRLLRAFRTVVQEVPDARLLFLGKGELDTYLKGLCWRYQIEKSVSFIGYTHETAYYLSHARAFAMTSQCEGFPNAMVQAMACGAPVVAPDAPGGIRDILGLYEAQAETHSAWEDDLEAQGIRVLPYGLLTPQLPKLHHPPMEANDEAETLLARALVTVLTQEDVYRDLSRRARERSKAYVLEDVMRLWQQLLDPVR